MNAPVPFDASDLAATVERARALLDDGDVAAARMLAAGVYDAAKAGAAFATRFGAAERLVDKARRLQGDALLIESRAKVQLANDYDAAQAAGAARKPGQRGKAVADEDSFSAATVEEIGLSRQEIHEARKLRDAERQRPGIVERAIQARLEAGLEPSRANLRATVGTRSHTAEERGDNLYETPIEATRTLLALESFAADVWEPACGRGAILRPLEAAGYGVQISDLVDYGTATKDGEVQNVNDFLTTRRTTLDDGVVGSGIVGRPDIVTNPPYGPVLNAFVAHALRVHRPRKMALLLNLNFFCGFDDDDRCYAMDECRPARILIFTRRLPMMHRDGWEGPHASSSMNTAWFIWERNTFGRYDGLGVTQRVDWKDYQNAPVLGPEKVATAQSKPTLPGLVWEQPRENGRLLAKLGKIEIGAVFPGRDDPKKTTWAFWLGAAGHASPQQKAKSIETAKAALAKRFCEASGLEAAE